ncbi:MAG TPA: SLC13 family permease [Nitrososphaeraceae archaeon]|nr:SLC13 family permease [Nitrososphaeraceae archaeon]
MQDFIPLLIFGIVYILIIGKTQFKIPIWISMSIGAIFMIITQTISIQQVIGAINFHVIGFLFGMFSIMSALDKSGVLQSFAIRMISKSKNSPSTLLAIFIIGMGLLSAFLVNDTVAILGVVIIAFVIRQIKRLNPQVLLIGLAFGISIGSTMTPIGNPQNLLISLQSGIDAPLTKFLIVLGPPTIISLLVTTILLKFYFKNKLLLSDVEEEEQQQQIQSSVNTLDSTTLKNPVERIIKDTKYAKISIFALFITIIGFILTEILLYLRIANIELSLIALLGAGILYTLSKQRKEILLSIDYRTLIFFISMFIFTSGLWYSGTISNLIQAFPNPNPNDVFQSSVIITLSSLGLSQLLSNVPFVSLYNYIMIDNGFTETNVDQWMMLAASSTIAGNLTILGAASNIIIIQTAESKGIRPFTFWEFFKIGIIITSISSIIFFLFIVVF